MDNTYKRTKSTETGSWKLAGWSRSRGPPPRPPLLEEDWRLTPIRYYDFLDLFVQEYYSYCDDFIFFWGRVLGCIWTWEPPSSSRNECRFEGKKKKAHPDERWVLDDYFGKLTFLSLLHQYGWWLMTTRRRRPLAGHWRLSRKTRVNFILAPCLMHARIGGPP